MQYIAHRRVNRQTAHHGRDGTHARPMGARNFVARGERPGCHGCRVENLGKIQCFLRKKRVRDVVGVLAASGHSRPVHRRRRAHVSCEGNTVFSPDSQLCIRGTQVVPLSPQSCAHPSAERECRHGHGEQFVCLRACVQYTAFTGSVTLYMF